MTADEIIKYVSTGSRSMVCVYRDVIEHLDYLVMSVYIMGKPGSYVLSVEFDPIDMVDDGEGWVWQAHPMQIDHLIELLEKHLCSSLEDWENVTQSGKLSFYSEEIDNVLYQKQEEVFKSQLKLGECLLPAGFAWNIMPSS